MEDEGPSLVQMLFADQLRRKGKAVYYYRRYRILLWDWKSARPKVLEHLLLLRSLTWSVLVVTTTTMMTTTTTTTKTTCNDDDDDDEDDNDDDDDRTTTQMTKQVAKHAV